MVRLSLLLVACLCLFLLPGIATAGPFGFFSLRGGNSSGSTCSGPGCAASSSSFYSQSVLSTCSGPGCANASRSYTVRTVPTITTESVQTKTVTRTAAPPRIVSVQATPPIRSFKVR